MFQAPLAEPWPFSFSTGFGDLWSLGFDIFPACRGTLLGDGKAGTCQLQQSMLSARFATSASSMAPVVTFPAQSIVGMSAPQCSPVGCREFFVFLVSTKTVDHIHMLKGLGLESSLHSISSKCCD